MRTRGRPRHPEVLTPRQQDVLRYLQQGLTNEEIAGRLGISADGVKFHVSEILARLGVNSRYEAAQWQPEAGRRRWALALAPFAALQRLKLNALTAAATGLAVLFVAAGIGALAWGIARTGGGRHAEPRATLGAADPDLVIFSAAPPGRYPDAHSRRTVTVYDASARQVAHQFEIGDGVTDQPDEVVAAGDKIVANLMRRVVRYELDGTGETELWRASDGSYAFGLAASPDGTRIAFSTYTPGDCERAAQTPGALATPCAVSPRDNSLVRAIDTMTGRGLLSVDQADPALGQFMGPASVVGWTAAGDAIIVLGRTTDEAPGVLAEVALDGTIRPLPGNNEFFAASPDGRRRLASTRRACDSLDLQRERIAIVDLADGRELAAVAAPDRNILPLEWSPAGDAVLYYALAIEPKPGEPGCYRNIDGTEEWHVLRDDGTVLDVPDPATARRAWYGDLRLVEYRCGGEPSPADWCMNPDQSYGTTGIYIGGQHVADVFSTSFLLVQQVAPSS
ncbi:MAG TPA: LuxR C-terminal-related transcriptional regulator [Dehalococcoidia bacterium]|nr:LuxR C-terminal-related transcriptional regulator [Dehalococcoidia bacterium]